MGDAASRNGDIFMLRGRHKAAILLKRSNSGNFFCVRLLDSVVNPTEYPVANR
jgi:hypothetical protein